MPTVHLVGRGSPEGRVSVSLEDIRLKLADVREALPRLRTELQKKWPVESVEIESRQPRAKNSHTPGAIIVAGCVVVVVRFALAAVDGAGKKFGEGIGDEIADHVRRWIRSFGGHEKETPQKRRHTKAKKQKTP
jgi:hypothetical protein